MLGVVITNRCIVGFGNILWIADIGTFFGILYIISAAKHSIFMHIFNLVSSAIIAATDFIQHVYFNGIMISCFFCPLMILGIIRWKKNEKKDQTKNLQKLSKKNWIIISSIFACALPTIILILWKLNSNLFYLDALASSFTLIMFILSSSMYIEQFYAAIIADLFLIAMYTVLTIQNLNNVPFLFMNIIYTILNVIALFNWRRLYKKQNENLAVSETTQENAVEKTE